MTDQPLADSPFVDALVDGAAPAIQLPTDTPRNFTIEDVLAMAKLPELVATVCIRPDLQADYDATLTELATLVDPTGQLLEDPDASLGGQSKAGRAEELNDRLEEIRLEMAGHLWRVRFRGMTSEDFSVFNKRFPNREGAQAQEYSLQLVAATAIDPPISYDQAQRLNAKLGARIMTELVNAAWKVCNEGGISIPKSLSFSRSQAPK